MIEIDGVGFANKGAEMMLRETVRRVRENLPEASLAIQAGSGPYSAVADLKLYQIARYRRYRFDWGQLFGLLPSHYRRRLGLVMNHETDAVLDASGYRYADRLNPRNVAGLARRSSQRQRRGMKYILLPQAFGPFWARSKRNLATIVENVDLIYARDEISYNHIVDIVGKSSNVRIAPDFTAPLPGFVRTRHQTLRNRFCLIPNKRMLDRTEAAVRDAYIPLMRTCTQHLCEHGTNPFLLIHDTGDVDLARSIVTGLNHSVDIVKESDARAIKGIIGISAAVISSRYHGLVNALSQGVPALGTGWSHKYKMLFRDYGVEEGLISVPLKPDLFEQELSTLIDDGARRELAARLRAAGKQQRLAIEAMWADVLAVLTGG